MACIDKIYVDNLKDYREVREYFKTHEFTTRDGNHIYLKDFLYENDEEECLKRFNAHESVPVTNTPFYVDEYLYRNCDVEVVRKYLDDVYGEGDFDLDSTEVRLPARKVVCVKKGCASANYPTAVYNSRTNTKRRAYWIDVNGKDGTYWAYFEPADKWYPMGSLEPWTSSCDVICNRSIKSVVRRILKKWRLPKGCVIKVSGNYMDEYYVFETI